MKRRRKRGVSLGTIVMLVLTCMVIAGFCLMLPRLTGRDDIRLNASELAVAIDRSIIQFANSSAVTASRATADPQPAASLPPEILTVATPEPTAVPKLRFTLTAGGSIKINSAVQKSLTDESGTHFDYLLENLSDSLTADLTIATLENSIISSAKPSDSNLPAEAASALRSAGINAISLGYYGAFDSGISGLTETRNSLSSAGLLPYGAYTSQQQRDSLTIGEFGGVKVALLSYQSDFNSAGKKQLSSEEQAFAVANLQLPVITADIANAKAQGAQVIVVSLCWGKATSTAPTDTQLELAQGIADAGADVILGTHPETVFPVQILTANRGDEKYHPVLCAYSLGNLFTYNREKRSSLAGILLHAQLEYDPETGTVAFDSLAYTPTYCWRGKENGVSHYRVLNSARTSQPEYVDQDQLNIMSRCLEIITDVMKDSVFSLYQ